MTPFTLVQGYVLTGLLSRPCRGISRLCSRDSPCPPPRTAAGTAASPPARYLRGLQGLDLPRQLHGMPVEVVHGDGVVPVAQVVFWVRRLLLPPHAADRQQNRCREKRVKHVVISSRQGLVATGELLFRLCKEGAGALRPQQPLSATSSSLLPTPTAPQGPRRAAGASGLAQCAALPPPGRAFTLLGLCLAKGKLRCGNCRCFNTSAGVYGPSRAEGLPRDCEGRRRAELLCSQSVRTLRR